MRFVLVSILLFLSPYIQACGDEHKTEHTPFANSNGNSSNLDSYEIFAPKKDGEYFLTSIYLHKKDELYISLDFQPAFTYPHHHQAFIDVSAKLVDEYEIYFNYSTTKDGGLVMCGGNVVKTLIKQLLSKKKAKEVIPPPPVEPPSNK
ncbi:hypothetical protein [Pseudoalteromonas apostichopi]|uniref:hypothetical protein n=1 Tax=Pseudoalteromonas apostichopi TaxID=3035452 RepID=UPI0025724B78|nr:hypothetical protein [Pseudoalteromonas sp. FE4]